MKPRGSAPHAGTLALLIVSIIGTLLVMVVVDRCAGFLMDVEDDLVFDRYSSVTYSTPEFRAKARINNLGFRGQDIDPKRRKQHRVMTLGDSFTFGWGVDDAETWPRSMEQDLRQQGVDIELVNLGQPGADPADYARIGQKAIWS